jgi:hypothetical protein
MLEHDEILRKALDVLERLQIPYMIVGSYASSLYGQARTTEDVDIVIDMAYGLVEPFCQSFPPPEFYISPEAVRQAISRGGQFNLIQSATSDKIDFMLVRHGTHHEAQIARRRRMPALEGREAYVARPEDVILAKMEYYREGGSEKHLRDITGMLQVSAEDIDRDYVAQWAAVLGVTDIWQAILNRLGEGPGT